MDTTDRLEGAARLEGVRIVTNDNIIMTRVTYMKLCLYSIIGCILSAVGGAMIAITAK